VWLTPKIGASPQRPSIGQGRFRPEAVSLRVRPEGIPDRVLVKNVPDPFFADPFFAPGLVFEGEPYSVSWSTVATATSYHLEEQFNGGGWYSVYGGGSTEFNVAGRGTGNYGYRVKACNGFGCGPYSSTQTTSVQPGCSFPPCDPAIRDPDDPSKKKSGGEP
jgi:hypothetical protein